MSKKLECKRWTCTEYPAGNVVVRPTELPGDDVWLDVGYQNVSWMGEDELMAGKRQMAEDIQMFLEGYGRPRWLDDLERISESKLVGAAGECIYATGPVVDVDPPNLIWEQRNDPEAKAMRARLIDRLCGTGERRR